MRVACAQINTVVGDIDGNAERVRDAIRRGHDHGAAIVLTPELAITGYPPEDLLLRPSFADASRAALDDLAREVTGGVAIVGFVEHEEDVHNAAAVIADGQVQAVYRKRFLPNYGVFDEKRIFNFGIEFMTDKDALSYEWRRTWRQEVFPALEHAFKRRI